MSQSLMSSLTTKLSTLSSGITSLARGARMLSFGIFSGDGGTTAGVTSMGGSGAASLPSCPSSAAGGKGSEGGALAGGASSAGSACDGAFGEGSPPQPDKASAIRKSVVKVRAFNNLPSSYSGV